MDRPFQQLFEALPIGALIVDRQERIKFVNRAFAEFLRYERDELLTKSLLDITSARHEKLVDQYMRELVEGERRYFEMETRYQRKDGEHVWGYPVRMLHPHPIDDEEHSILIFVVDITERRQLEKKMRQAEKMSAIGLLTQSVVHDVKNILTVIRTTAQLVGEEPGDLELVKESAERIDAACDRADQMARQLVEFGRPEQNGEKPVSLNDVVETAHNFFTRLLPPTVTIETDLDPTDPDVALDKNKLQQVVTNLILNARDAMDGRGTLRLKTDCISSADVDFPDISRLTEDEYAILSVCDTGTGIEDEMVDEIFDAFYSTKDGEGTGMGLNTVRTIIDQHRGHVEVRSRVGVGTCFDIYLPIGADESEETE